jgi:uncharacterized protein YxjI
MSKELTNCTKPIVLADTFGLFGRVVNCFGDNFSVKDLDGEEVERGSIESSTESKTITFLEGNSKFSEGEDLILYLEGSEFTSF